MIDRLTAWLDSLGIPLWIAVLTIIVIVAPFVLPPVKEWKTATVQEKFSVAVYFIAVLIVLVFFAAYSGVKR